jgi:hypothetical protein
VEVEVTTRTSWVDVALAIVNSVQLVALAYLAVQQGRSSRERIRRTALDDERAHQNFPHT